MSGQFPTTLAEQQFHRWQAAELGNVGKWNLVMEVGALVEGG